MGIFSVDFAYSCAKTKQQMLIRLGIYLKVSGKVWWYWAHTKQTQIHTYVYGERVIVFFAFVLLSHFS